MNSFLIRPLGLFFLLFSTVFPSIYGTVPEQIQLIAAGMSIQGAKAEQQDAYYIGQNVSYGLVAAIFDGHGTDGGKFAAMAQDTCVSLFLQYADRLKKAEKIADVKTIITHIFKEVNVILWQKYGHTAEGGTTALIAFRKNDRLFIAHCGDSRAVWGNQKHMQTKDHTGSNVKEIRRVGKKNIRFVQGVPRLGGTLMVTRSLGDFDLKKKGLSGKPDIVSVDLKKHPLVILGCDGLWDGTSTKIDKKSEQNDDNSFIYDTAYGVVSKELPDVDLAVKKIMAVALCSTLDLQGRSKALYNVGKLSEDASQSEIALAINSMSKTSLERYIKENQQYAHDNTTAIVLCAL